MLEADGLRPGVEKAGVDRKLGEAELRAPGHPWGILAGERRRLKSSSSALRVSGLGTGLLAAEMCGLGVADKRVGWRRGGWREEVKAA